MTSASPPHEQSVMSVRAGASPGPGAVAAEPLTEASFAPFGRVLRLAEAPSRVVNEGRAVRRELGPALVHAAPAARAAAALYTIAASPSPVRIAMAERHPLSEQLFWPLEVDRWLAVVFPDAADGGPDVARARAFVAGPEAALVYAPGVWHAPLVALDRHGLLLMRMVECGTPDDCHERALAVPFELPA
jgi:ureidoglycolate lyase